VQAHCLRRPVSGASPEESRDFSGFFHSCDKGVPVNLGTLAGPAWRKATIVAVVLRALPCNQRILMWHHVAP